MIRISVNEEDPGYCPWLCSSLDGLGDMQIYLKDAPDAEIYFETVDQDKREAVIYVFDKKGDRIIIGDQGSLKATIKDVNIGIQMTNERLKRIKEYFTIHDNAHAWLNAVRKAERLESELSETRNEQYVAKEALAKLVLPKDAKAKEQFAIYHVDQMLTVYHNNGVNFVEIRE